MNHRPLSVAALPDPGTEADYMFTDDEVRSWIDENAASRHLRVALASGQLTPDDFTNDKDNQ